MFQRGNIVQFGWHSTPDGESMIKKFYDARGSGKKLFGILERPTNGVPGIEEVSYKLNFVGKSGIGKTSVIARLAGLSSPDLYVETPGIRVTDIYWPVKIWDKTIVFKLHCWEAGSDCVKKFSHISMACEERSDLIVHLFCFNDLSSFNELSQAVEKYNQEQENAPALLALGTRNNPGSKLEVTGSTVRDFETKYNIKVVSFPNFQSGTSEISKVFPILNILCETLWIRDQQYILNQGVTI